MSDYDKGGTVPAGAAVTRGDLRAESVFSPEQWDRLVALLNREET